MDTRHPHADTRRCAAARAIRGRTLVIPLGPTDGAFPTVGIELGNFEALVLAVDDQTSGGFTLLQTQSEPPDFGPPMHLHRDAAEAFYVLEGEYLMYVEDRQQVCPPGTFVYVPRAVPHTFKVVSSGPGTKLNLFSPGAMIGFFEELAEAEANARSECCRASTSTADESAPRIVELRLSSAP